MLFGLIGSKNDGQPVPLSNFELLSKRAFLQHTHENIPLTFGKLSLLNGRSVPCLRVTLYASSDNFSRHSASVLIILTIEYYPQSLVITIYSLQVALIFFDAI